MGHYEQRLAADKDELRRRVAVMGERVREAVAGAIAGLLTGDHDKCYGIVLGDLPINREIRAIDARCHAFVARHLPSAGHLRFVSSTMRMTVAIERVGDYAVTIAREAVQLSSPPPEAIAQHLKQIAAQSCGMFEQAMRSYVESDAELARETKPLAGSVHLMYDRVFRELTEDCGERPLKDSFALLVAFNRLERVSDQAKNICEDALFELEGETKPPKVYRVLFLDDDNALLGPLAEAIARKSFPKSGKYDTAGYAPAASASPVLARLAETLALDVSDARPAALSKDLSSLAKYHVIVSLAPEGRASVPEVPFHTAFVRWDIAVARGPEGDPDLEALTAASQTLASEIRQLMVTLRGEDAG